MASRAGGAFEGPDQAPAVLAEKWDGVAAQGLCAAFTGHREQQPYALSDQSDQHGKILKKHAVICQGCGCQIGHVYVIGQARSERRSPLLLDLRPCSCNRQRPVWYG